jgi:transcriptional regulator with XRE-family HTH domain
VSLIPKIATRIRQLRQRHRLTQEEFAQLAGFSFKFYQQLESGRKKQIWLETVERLAKAYGVEAWQMLAPGLPADTKLGRRPTASRVHNTARKSSPPRGPETGGQKILGME